VSKWLPQDEILDDFGNDDYILKYFIKLNFVILFQAAANT
jgi:hypothetical protein